MGSDDKAKGLTETIVEGAKGLVDDVYKDGAKPTVTVVGETLGATARLLLAPVNAAIRGLNAVGERLSARVGKKLERVPPERQLPAPATIAASAALQYALLGEGDEVADLREMFENLLVASMDRSTTASVHPAFVSMLAQITPDEAWILKSITITPEQSFALVKAKQIYANANDGEYFRERGILCTLGLGIGIDESRQAQYLTNLARLGLLEMEWIMTVVGVDTEYAELERRIRARPDLRDIKLEIDQGLVTVTPLGEQFWNTCVHPRTV